MTQVITGKTFKVITQTNIGETRTFIHAANHRQAALIARKMLKNVNPNIKSITIAPN